jgi:Domain of unknown function (DUF4177)
MADGWEYKTVNFEFALPQDELNKLGAEGWEVVNIERTFVASGYTTSEGALGAYRYTVLFKRRKQTTQ